MSAQENVNLDKIAISTTQKILTVVMVVMAKMNLPVFQGRISRILKIRRNALQGSVRIALGKIALFGMKMMMSLLVE
jgi:hypothetical protein